MIDKAATRSSKKVRPFSLARLVLSQNVSTMSFSVTEHILPCQYIREYPHAVRSDHAPLRLAIKEYRPLNISETLPGSVTIIAAHANGFPKETYEPFFADLYQALGAKIRAIWIADCCHQGASGVLNEDIVGDDPNWFDHSRDLLYMVNHFRDQMPRPIIGVAHSLGAAQLVHLSLIHPRLFHSLALIEPVIQPDHPSGPNAALFSSLRQDTWPSREAAESSFRKSNAFKSWDPRALDRYLKHGLRETPTPHPRGPVASPSPVTLTTPKQQEAWTYVRSNFISLSDSNKARLVAPDLSESNAARLFHRPEMALTFQNLPHLRPNVLWVFGTRSYINTPETSRVEKVARTGTGIGGSGGAMAGRVESVTIAKGSHMLPFENIQECVSTLVPWLEKQTQDFEMVEHFLQEHDGGKSEQNMKSLSKMWLNNVRLDPYQQRDEKSKL